VYCVLHIDKGVFNIDQLPLALFRSLFPLFFFVSFAARASDDAHPPE
jgi:hypothetical protein